MSGEVRGLKRNTFLARATWLNTETGSRGVYTEQANPQGGPPGDYPGSLWRDTENDAAPDSISAFQWVDGNYGCDDNRGHFFEGIEDIPCSEHIYVIEKLEALDLEGNVVHTFQEPFETPETRRRR